MCAVGVCCGVCQWGVCGWCVWCLCVSPVCDAHLCGFILNVSFFSKKKNGVGLRKEVPQTFQINSRSKIKKLFSIDGSISSRSKIVFLIFNLESLQFLCLLNPPSSGPNFTTKKKVAGVCVVGVCGWSEWCVFVREVCVFGSFFGRWLDQLSIENSF